MNKHLLHITAGLVFIAVLIFVGILIYDDYLYKQEGLGLNRPDLLGSYYQYTGYFKIDPKTVLISLESGNNNVFTPLLVDDALELEEFTDLSIYWTQADFLKIASALGQIVWHDPMDLEDWSVYSISFDGSCGNHISLDFANITYYKKVKNSYTTRLIEIEPYFGRVGWGGGRIYSQPILRKWVNVDLLRAKITADDALQIVNEDIKANFQIEENFCSVWMGSPDNNDANHWYLDILLGPEEYIPYMVDFITGNLIRKTK